MMARRWLAFLLALALATGCAAAEPACSPAPAYAPANMAQEDIQRFVEAMFAAAAGTDAAQERALRESMTDAECALRNAEGAAYRERTLPWLIAAFSPPAGDENASETPAPETESAPASEAETKPAPETETPIPETESAPAPETEAAPEVEAQPVYSFRDSFSAFAQSERGEEYLALMEGMGGEGAEACLGITREICGMWLAQVNHESLAEMNGDYRCWIYAPGTQIDYPVVQCGDNSRYLKRMFNGARNSAGTLFIDYRNLPDFLDPNTLVYGHHMRNDSMFGSLTDYVEQAYYEGHPVMLVMSAKEIFLLELLAGYTTSEKDHCYDIAISDEEDMAAFIGEALRKSDFVSGVQPGTNERLVTLSTCAYAFENARYILIGRIVPVWNGETEEKAQD